MQYLNYPDRVAIPDKEYEKLWQKYQTEGIAKNMTLQMFCSMNNDETMIDDQLSMMS